MKSTRNAYPQLGKELAEAIEGKVLIDVKDILTFDPEKAVSTRVASGNAINHFVKIVPSIFGGSADLSNSTMTDIKGEEALRSSPMQVVMYTLVFVNMPWEQQLMEWLNMVV